jgi:alpha-glucoside transport system substrate-binding protein
MKNKGSVSRRDFLKAISFTAGATILAACAPAVATTAAPQPTTAPPAATQPPAPTAMPAATQAPAATAMPAATQAAAATPTTAAAPPTDYSKVGPELAAAFTGKYKGTVVNMAGPFTDQDAVKFNQSVKDFQDKTGINILYAGSKEFEASIRIQVEGGTPPDIVDFPQPGLLASFASAGKVLDAGKLIDPAWLTKNYTKAWLDLGQMKNKDGSMFTAGIWARANGKDIVFYPKKAFDAAGYKVPTTWDEMMTLSKQIVSDGDTPWCIGIESGAATGWPATDWIEALMLRTTTPENYDKWVAGTLKFDSPEVRKAISYMTPIWFDDKMVYGGTKAIASTAFGDAPKPMFDNPPKAWLHKQGNFITSFFPTNLVAGVDYDVFYLPPIDPALGTPFEVAGDIYGAFNDRPDVRAVLQYFTLGESLKTWIEANGAIGPQNDADLEWYQDPTLKKIAGMIKNATAVRFDGSDSMPAAVGTGSFWKAMTSWVSGSITEDVALKEIDASWPTK